MWFYLKKTHLDSASIAYTYRPSGIDKVQVNLTNINVRKYVLKSKEESSEKNQIHLTVVLSYFLYYFVI